MPELIQLALRPRTLRTSLCVGPMAGRILKLNKQGARIFDPGEHIDRGHLILDFLVPFWVCSLSAALNPRKGRREE